MTMGQEFQNAYFERNPNAYGVMELFEYLPAVYFYAKDEQSRYVRVSQAVLTTIFRRQREEDVLGRTDREFQPPALAEAYLAAELGDWA